MHRLRRRWWVLVPFALVAALLLPLAGDLGAWAAVALLFAVVVALAAVVLGRVRRVLPQMPLTRPQELAALIGAAACLFAINVSGDVHRSAAAWLWAAGWSLGEGVLSVLVVRRSSHFKRSRAVRLSFGVFAAVVVACVAYAASHHWRDESILDALLISSCGAAVLSMAFAGRPWPTRRQITRRSQMDMQRRRRLAAMGFGVASVCAAIGSGCAVVGGLVLLLAGGYAAGSTVLVAALLLVAAAIWLRWCGRERA
jgi:hypothetical protein